MPDYLAHITVHDVPDDDTRTGMADALGAVDDTTTASGAVHASASDPVEPPTPLPGPVTFTVPGEAPDLETAELVAQRHAAELLDGFTWDVEVVER